MNNRSKLALSCVAVGSDTLSGLGRSGSKFGHVDGDLVEVNKKMSSIILKIMDL